MKPQQNIDELYQTALKNEREALKQLNVPITLTEKPRPMYTLGIWATGIAAVLVIGWMLLQPRIEHRKVEQLYATIEQATATPVIMNQKGDIKAVERFNTSFKNLSHTNETIVRFNSKIKKFQKSNS